MLQSVGRTLSKTERQLGSPFRNDTRRKAMKLKNIIKNHLHCLLGRVELGEWDKVGILRKVNDNPQNNRTTRRRRKPCNEVQGNMRPRTRRDRKRLEQTKCSKGAPHPRMSYQFGGVSLTEDSWMKRLRDAQLALGTALRYRNMTECSSDQLHNSPDNSADHVAVRQDCLHGRSVLRQAELVGEVVRFQVLCTGSEGNRKM